MRYFITRLGVTLLVLWDDASHLTVTVGSYDPVTVLTDPDTPAFDLAEDAKGHLWIVLGTDTFPRYRSTDGGATWSLWSPA